MGKAGIAAAGFAFSRRPIFGISQVASRVCGEDGGVIGSRSRRLWQSLPIISVAPSAPKPQVLTIGQGFRFGLILLQRLDRL
jgi:hypothetical protein